MHNYSSTSLKDRYLSTKDKIRPLFSKCVNIGCGDHVKRGWLNLDIAPFNSSVQKFDVTDKADLDWLSSQKFDYIECMHIIGYLNLPQMLAFFKSCFSALDCGGKLVLEFPDIKKVSYKIVDSEFDQASDDEYLEVIRSLYAYSIEEAQDITFRGQTYISGWTASFIALKLRSLGFSDVDVLAPLTHEKRLWRDSRVEAIK